MPSLAPWGFFTGEQVGIGEIFLHDVRQASPVALQADGVLCLGCSRVGPLEWWQSHYPCRHA